MSLAVLMFHALYRDEEQYQALRPDERPYAISDSDFDHFLTRLGQLAPRYLLHPDDQPIAVPGPSIIVTFDDGHASATANALPILHRHQVPAVFFVTTDFITERDDYLAPQQLRELAAAGMSVQSHGKTHRFLNTLSEPECRQELTESRRFLEDTIGQPVDAISFPGGRYEAREIAFGQAAGYRDFHTSRFGCNRAADINRRVYRRIAYRAGMSVQLLLDLALGKRLPTMKQRAVYGAKRSVRGLLGEQRYQRLYERIKGSE